jgi:myo-inositol catabolism protein IolC
MDDHSDSNAGVAGDGQSDASEDRVLLILAIDHRNSLERELYGLSAPATPSQAARINADKVIVYQALLDASAQLPRSVQPGILIDEQYGAGVAALAAATKGIVNLSMPIEASGQKWFHFAYGDDWKRHAEFFASDHVKVLVRDNPELDGNLREQQAERVAQVSSWAASANRPLIIELLVPPSDEDNYQVKDDQARYDESLRPTHVVEVIEYLQDRGVEPAIWKLEGLDAPKDAVAILQAARRGDRHAQCIVLGRHAPHDQVDQWLEVTAPIPGWIGFAIGRSIWWDPLHAHLHHHATAGETRRRICGAYLDFARFYVKAKEGAGANRDHGFW